MSIVWYGHSCFRLLTKDTSLLIDPFSKEIGLKPPRINDQIILVTHSHYDHNNIDNITDEVFLINGPGEYEVRGIQIKGIQSFHDKSNGQERGLNTIYKIKMEDIRIVHMGDFGEEKLTDGQISGIGEVDILMIPVGGVYTIDYKEAVQIINQVQPKIVIPMHYKISGLKLNIDGVDKFLKEIGIKPEKVEKIYKIQKKNLPVEEMKIIQMTL